MDSAIVILLFAAATVGRRIFCGMRGACLTSTTLLSLACNEVPVRDTGTWVAEVDTIGDTVVVRTISGSVWGETATLLEDLAIGMLEGPEELTFGSVRAIAVDEHGGMYVLDGSVPAIRHFDAAGTYVRTFGRDGSGPGEYTNKASGLAVRPDGRVLLLDLSNQRLTVFEPDGTPWAHWRVQNSAFWRQPLTVDHAGHTYMKVFTSLQREIEPDLRAGWLHLDREGEIVDTMSTPRIEGETTLHRPTGQKLAAWSPRAFMVVGVNERYSFDIRGTGEHVIRVQKVYERVRYEKKERSYTVPEFKPPITDFLLGEAGRIWAKTSMTDRMFKEISARIYDVFEPDGTYLGDIHVPWPRMSVHVIRGDTVWGTKRGDFDETYVVRYVIKTGGLTEK